MSIDRTTKINVLGFTTKYLGKKTYELQLTSRIAATGVAVNHDYVFQFSHRLEKVEVKHKTAAEADGTDAFSWSLSRQLRGADFGKLHDVVGLISSYFLVTFDEHTKFPNMLYRFTENTTATDLIDLIITIQLLE